MKVYSKLITLSILTIIITSCDPPHYIDFINQSKSEAKVKLNLNLKNENFDLQEIANGDSIVFHLNKKDTANIHFGIGNWSDDEIEEVIKSIKSIEIETKEIKTIYKNETSMKNLLINNRHGAFLKSKIEIEIE